MISKRLNNKGISTIVILILILCLISAIGGTYYYYNFKVTKNENKVTEDTKKENVNENKISENRNWECDNNLYKCETVLKINKIRESNNLKKLEVDKELCEAARDLAFNYSIVYSEEKPTEAAWNILTKPYFESLLKSFKYVGLNKVNPQKTLMKEVVWPKWKKGENVNLYYEESVIESASNLKETVTHICIADPINGRDFAYKGKDYSFFTPTTIVFYGEKK